MLFQSWNRVVYDWFKRFENDQESYEDEELEWSTVNFKERRNSRKYLKLGAIRSLFTHLTYGEEYNKSMVQYKTFET